MEGLASAMTATLRPVLPPDVEVRSRGTSIAVSGKNSWAAGGPTEIDLASLELDSAADPHEQVVGACLLVLERVQDFVAEVTTVPWPGERSMPTAHATIRNGQIHCRYGSVARPVLPLPPIELSDLAE